MKKLILLSNLVTLTALAAPRLESPTDLWTACCPDGHAPIGVMAEHTHLAGESMISFRHMSMHMEGNISGTQTVSNRHVFANGFTAAPREMQMHMNMIGFMHAPTDWLTLGLMTSYNFKNMELESAPPAPAHGHMAMAAKPGHHAHAGVFGHDSEGWGDTSLTALFRLFSGSRQSIHAGVGLGFPTASVGENQDGTYLPYGMQLGRGLWDFRPSLTYLGQSDFFSWGAQGAAVIAIDDENSAGFDPGDVFTATTWTAFRICDSASVSGRAVFTHQDGHDGHFNGPHNHAAPPHFPANYGGDIVELGVGLNLFQGKGRFAGNRGAIEALWPIYQDANGIQLERDFTLTFGWQFSF